MMVRDHTKANNQLESILKEKNLQTSSQNNTSEKDKQDNKDQEKKDQGPVEPGLWAVWATRSVVQETVSDLSSR